MAGMAGRYMSVASGPSAVRAARVITVAGDFSLSTLTSFSKGVAKGARGRKTTTDGRRFSRSGSEQGGAAPASR